MVFIIRFILLVVTLVTVITVNFTVTLLMFLVETISRMELPWVGLVLNFNFSK